MFENIRNALRSFFSANTKSDLERYLESKNITSSQDLDFWISEYDNQVRLMNRSFASGDGRNISFYDHFV
jgi:hypothetical protein